MPARHLDTLVKLQYTKCLFHRLDFEPPLAKLKNRKMLVLHCYIVMLLAICC